MQELLRPQHCWQVGLLVLLLSIAVAAQEFRGSLTGKVTDQTGAEITGATASITNLDTNITATTTTNEDGGARRVRNLHGSVHDRDSQPGELLGRHAVRGLEQ